MRARWAASTWSLCWSEISRTERKSAKWSGQRRVGGRPSMVRSPHVPPALGRADRVSFDCRRPLPRSVVALGRQRRGAVPPLRAVDTARDRVRHAGPGEGGQRRELRRPRAAAGEQLEPTEFRELERLAAEEHSGEAEAAWNGRTLLLAHGGVHRTLSRLSHPVSATVTVNHNPPMSRR